MDIALREENGVRIAIVRSEELVITDVQSALDLIAAVAWETGSRHVVLDRSAITEAFFDLSTRLAGDVLQKFTNYGVRVAIVGDFSNYSSKSLQDFIRESNKGQHVFFAADEARAVGGLSMIPS